jgi:hypothetical protein
MNTRNRTKTLETLVNKVEGDTIADHLRDLGMAFSTWSRLVMFGAIAAHDAHLARPVEPRKCRDTPMPSRASMKTWSSQATVRHREKVRGGFGGALRPIRV